MHYLNWFQRATVKLTVFGILLTFVSSLCRAQKSDTDSLASWLSDNSIVWSAPSNGFWTGLIPFPKNHPDVVDVFLLSSNKIDNLAYIFPPKRALERLELRDAVGALIPIQEKDITDRLKYRISLGSLPHNRDGIFIGNGTWYDYVFIIQNKALYVREITVKNMFKIKQEGIYSLSICPAIYHLETNRQYLDRVDLPCVSAKVYLHRSSDE